ncbi:MAG: type II toxin-antitoxin system HicA family toxin [Desulfobacterales bacterium]|nr:type II toxin-antitoxin system HicA family toxin [Desulfobacterales bacterium]
MKLPRNINGDDLIKNLRKFGYEINRQTGSHVRLTLNKAENEYHLTIPRHKSLKIGTFNNILNDIVAHLDISKEELITSLFE